MLSKLRLDQADNQDWITGAADLFGIKEAYKLPRLIVLFFRDTLLSRKLSTFVVVSRFRRLLGDNCYPNDLRTK